MRPDDLLSRPVMLVFALAIVSIVPFLFMGATAFVKISTVLHIVRSAIGTQGVPSNTVVLALATALTLIAMAPVGEKIAARAAPIFAAKEAPDTTTLVSRSIAAVRDPLHDFLRANASDKELGRFVAVAKKARDAQDRQDKPADITAEDWSVIVPAFVVTELTEAFSVGFLLFLPFLILDLIVANVLVALGMQSLSATHVSLPFKLLLFVAIDGWGLLAQALVAGYRS